MHMKALGGIACLVLLGACAQVPRPSTYPYSFQQHMQAAHHWQVLASQVAGELATSLTSGTISRAEAVYVRADDRSPFGQAFRGFLITELTKQGFAVSPTQTHPSQAKIDWGVQLVTHQADRKKPPILLGNTLLAGLAYGIAHAWDELSLAAAGAVTAFGLMPILDVMQGVDTGPLPHSEIIITTMISTPQAILSRNSHIFYINDLDQRHYRSFAALETPLVRKTYGVVDR
jgi:hypothetical protein